MNAGSEMGTHRPLIPIVEAQAYLGGYSRRGLYQLATSGEIDMIKVGGRTMVTLSSLDAYVTRQVQAAHAVRSLQR